MEKRNRDLEQTPHESWKTKGHCGDRGSENGQRGKKEEESNVQTRFVRVIWSVWIS